MSKSVFVLAIAGTSASGKSTTVKRLTSEINNTASLFFDDYQDEHTYPDSFEVFIEQDFDPNLFKSEKFAADIARIKAGESITAPGSDEAITSPGILILEEPTGRSRDIMRPLIDAVVWLDVPYDMTLARRIVRTAGQIPDNPEMQARTIVGFAEMYLQFLGDVYKNVGEKVKAQSDFIVDGTQSPEDIVKEIKIWMDTSFDLQAG